MSEAAPPPAPTSPSEPTSPPPPDDEIDPEFVREMSRWPLFALAWVVAAAVAHQIWAALSPTTLNGGPLVVVCFGMILAAVIDGWALKVPNWVTMPLILSGWILGLLHSFGVKVDAGTGGIDAAFFGTILGFILLFPMLAIRGVGEGDVKMQMGFGSWVGAYFGLGEVTTAAGLPPLSWPYVVFMAFVFGALTGGVFGLAMILIRRQWGANAAILKGIGGDLKDFATGNVSEATKRAEERRKVWVKLPYGIPLCVGFLMFLGYKLILTV